MAGFREMHGANVRVLGGLVIFLATACGGRTGDALSSSVPSCVPGQQIACGCPNGLTGAQICAEDGTFAACSCTGAVSNPVGTRQGMDGTSNGGSALGTGDSGSVSSAPPSAFPESASARFGTDARWPAL
jgi:hypothetical protein